MQIAKELSDVFLKEIKSLYNLENIGIVDEAEEPQIAYNVHHKKDLIIFLSLGILAASILIISIYLFANTVNSEEDIENFVEIKTIRKNSIK